MFSRCILKKKIGVLGTSWKSTKCPRCLNWQAGIYEQGALKSYLHAHQKTQSPDTLVAGTGEEGERSSPQHWWHGFGPSGRKQLLRAEGRSEARETPVQALSESRMKKTMDVIYAKTQICAICKTDSMPDTKER